MKNCPLKIDEDACEQCHWNFGRDRCAMFSIAIDMSVLAEESVKQTKILEKIAEGKEVYGDRQERTKTPVILG